MDPADIEDLFDQLEDLSDSGPEVDTVSIGSTPKPSLKPFFNSSKNLMQHESARTSVASVGSTLGTLSHGVLQGERLDYEHYFFYF